MASVGQDILQYKTFCLITGASKGFGRCLAVELASKFPKGSVLLLMARSHDKLLNVKAEIETRSPKIRVTVARVDLGEVGQSCEDVTCEEIFEKSIIETLKHYDVDPDDFEQAFIAHNAGSLGIVEKNMIDIDVTKELQSYWGLNLTSVVALNSRFLKVFSHEKMKQRLVMNITSICALQPFKSWSLYCAGKAARDMLFRTMALEEPNIRVLNYAPGPIDTDMQLEARTRTGDKDLKKMFSELHTERKLLSCENSVSKLMTLLEKNNFDSGAHIDYYDL